MVNPPAETPGGVKTELARGGAGADGESCVAAQGQFAQGEVCQNVGIMEQDRLRAVQKAAGMEKSASGVEQQAALVANADIDSEVAVGSKELLNLLCKMVDVDNYIGDSGLFYRADYSPQHRLAAYGDEGLGVSEGKRFEPGSQSGGKNQGFHWRSR